MKDQVSLWIVFALILAGITYGFLLASFLTANTLLFSLSFIPLALMLGCTLVFIVQESDGWWFGW